VEGIGIDEKHAFLRRKWDDASWGWVKVVVRDSVGSRGRGAAGTSSMKNFYISLNNFMQ